MKVELVPLELLRPHEEIIIKKVNQLEKMTHRWNAYTKPLLLDRELSLPIVQVQRYSFPSGQVCGVTLPPSFARGGACVVIAPVLGIVPLEAVVFRVLFLLLS